VLETELAAPRGNVAARVLLLPVFGIISGGLGGMGFPAVDLVIAGTTFATVSSLARRVSR